MSISDEKFGDFRSFCQNQNYLKAAEFIYQEVQPNGGDIEFYFSYGHDIFKESSIWSQAVVFTFLSLIPDERDIQAKPNTEIADYRLKNYLEKQGLTSVLNFSKYISQYLEINADIDFRLGFPIFLDRDAMNEAIFDLRKIYVDFEDQYLDQGKTLPLEIDTGLPYHGMLPIMSVDEPFIISYLITNGVHKGKITGTLEGEYLEVIFESFNDFINDIFYSIFGMWDCEIEATEMLPQQILIDYERWRMSKRTT